MSNRRRPNKKNIESNHLTQNNVLKALTWKEYFYKPKSESLVTKTSLERNLKPKGIFIEFNCLKTDSFFVITQKYFISKRNGKLLV